MFKVNPVLCDSAHRDVVIFEIQTFEISECEYLTNGISFFVQMTLNTRHVVKAMDRYFTKYADEGYVTLQITLIETSQSDLHHRSTS